MMSSSDGELKVIRNFPCYDASNSTIDKIKRYIDNGYKISLDCSRGRLVDWMTVWITIFHYLRRQKSYLNTTEFMIHPSKDVVCSIILEKSDTAGRFMPNVSNGFYPMFQNGQCIINDPFGFSGNPRRIVLRKDVFVFYKNVDDFESCLKEVWEVLTKERLVFIEGCGEQGMLLAMELLHEICVDGNDILVRPWINPFIGKKAPMLFFRLWINNDQGYRSYSTKKKRLKKLRNEDNVVRVTNDQSSAADHIKKAKAEDEEQDKKAEEEDDEKAEEEDDEKAEEEDDEKAEEEDDEKAEEEDEKAEEDEEKAEEDEETFIMPDGKQGKKSDQGANDMVTGQTTATMDTRPLVYTRPDACPTYEQLTTENGNLRHYIANLQEENNFLKRNEGVMLRKIGSLALHIDFDTFHC